MKQRDGLNGVPCAVLFVVLVLPWVSQAQTVLTDTPLAPIEAQRARPRLRLGLGGGGSGLVTDSLTGYRTGFGGVGFGFDVEVQLADRFAVYARFAADTIILNTTGYGAVLGEVAVDRFSLAAGLGLMASLNVPVLRSPTTGTFLTVPIVLGITPLGRLDTSVSRQGLHIWVEGAPVVPLDGKGTLGGYGGLKLGYIWG
jgi:hypothetical protein